MTHTANTHALIAHSNALQRSLTACERELSDARRVATGLGKLLLDERRKCKQLELELTA